MNKSVELTLSEAQEVLLQTEEMLPMPDGVRLRTIIVRPKAGTARPVLVQRSPYAFSETYNLEQGLELARRGFSYVLQFCRGTCGSEGKWEPNVNEREDGLALLRWLNEQPWAESIGYFGESYLALTGWVLMDALPEKVKGMYLGVYGTDRHCSAYQDGLFRQDILTSWAMDNAGKPVTADYLASCAYLPQVRVDRDLWDADLPWYRDWITHPDRDDAYWQQGFWAMLREMPKKVRVPLVIEEGWYDHHLGSSLSGWRSMDEESRSRCLLRIGAWKHMKQPAAEWQPCGHLENDSFVPVYEFFKALLLDKKTPPHGVQLYTIGADEWNSGEVWPSPAGEINFWLDAGTEGKRLLTAPPQNSTRADYVYDPANPVPSHGTESCLKSMSEVGSLLQPGPDYRADVLSFMSEPLEQDLTILGNISADLFVSSDAEDTAFVMKVCEVLPDGSTYNIRTAATTLAYRGHSTTRQSNHPGDVVPVRLDAWDIAWKMKRESRIRVDITSSDFPQYSVHSNFAGVWAEQKQQKKAAQTVCCGGGHASVVSIPFFTSG